MTIAVRRLHDGHEEPGRTGVRFKRGPYTPERLLGRGRTCLVELVRRTREHDTGERFAMKRLLPEFATNPAFRDMFSYEGRLAATLSHANVVEFVDFGEHDGELALILGYVDGTSAGRLLRSPAMRGRAFPMEAALYIADRVLLALSHVHEATDAEGRPLGLVHGDVSPGNVLLGSMGEVVLSDFGVARCASRGGGQWRGPIDGKLGYMPPEQLEGFAIDRRADLFSLGIVLFELLTGTQFFHAENEFDLSANMHEVSLAPLSNAIGRGLPLDLRLILASALATDASDRFADAGEFRQAISLFANHHGIRVSRGSLIQWIREHGIWPLRSGTRPAVSPSDRDEAPDRG